MKTEDLAFQIFARAKNESTFTADEAAELITAHLGETLTPLLKSIQRAHDKLDTVLKHRSKTHQGLTPRIGTLIARHERMKTTLQQWGILHNTPPLITDKKEWQDLFNDTLQKTCVVFREEAL